MLPSTQFAASGPRFGATDAKNNSLNHLIPYESFIDTILGGCIRLKGLLRTQPHYEVYAAESLSDVNQNFAGRAYILRGLSLRLRNYRIRNLNRAEARSSWIGSLEQGGQRWLVFADARVELVPEPFRDGGPLWCTEEEFDRAFAVLEPRRPYNSENVEEEAIQDGVVVEASDTSSETAREKKLSRRLDACQAPEVIHRLRKLLVANYYKSTSLSEKRKKIKSPEQGKRLRDRQRLSRQTKRRAKAALETGANSDSMCQTLDITSGPRIEVFSGSESNNVATSQTIDNS